ncbi:MAG: helix-turn-helix transcriptional regulator [Akkermansiaceae bacterium]
MNRVDRLVAMILLLQSKRSITAEEIATHFEISVRTVYRDVTALGEAGVPIIAEAGVGYSLMKGYHLPPVMFTQSEAQALAMGGVLVDSLTDPALQQQMKNALLKVSAVLPADQRSSLAKLSGSTRLYQQGSTSKDHHQAEIPILQQALIEQRIISLSYQDSYANHSERQIEPVELAYYLEKWHLLAWCRLRNDYRDFRLDRVVNLKMLDEHFPLRERVSVNHFLEEWIKKEVRQTVKVKFEKWAIDRAEREWRLGGERLTESNGWIEMNLNSGDLEWLVNWLLSFGTSVQILDSDELKTLLTKRAAELAAHHKVK